MKTVTAIALALMTVATPVAAERLPDPPKPPTPQQWNCKLMLNSVHSAIDLAINKWYAQGVRDRAELIDKVVHTRLVIAAWASYDRYGCHLDDNSDIPDHIAANAVSRRFGPERAKCARNEVWVDGQGCATEYENE
jgi:hypothetical protein